MGFGLLFTGFFFLLFMPVGAMGILPNFSAIGCLLMFAALKRLRYYAPDCKGFKAAYFLLIPQTVLTLALFVFGLLGFGTAESGTVALVRDITELAADLCIAVSAICIFLGVHKLANYVDLPRLAARSLRMLSFTAAHGVLTVTAAVTWMAKSAVTSDRALIAFNYIDMAAFIIEYAFIFLGLAFFFTCYAQICLEGDEDMPYKEDMFDKISAMFRKNKNK